MTALTRACKAGHTSTARALVKAGANVEARSDISSTPLIEASFYGHLDTIKFLVEEGHVNVEAKTTWGGKVWERDVAAYLQSKGAPE